MKEKQRAQWEKIRSRGTWPYILLLGSLLGLLNVIVSRLIEYLLFPNDYDPPRLFISLPVYSIGGVFFAYLSWKANENR